MGPTLSKYFKDTKGKSHNEEQYFGKSVFGALPIQFVQDTLDDDLLIFLQSDPFFQTPEDKLESIGYSKAIDYPELTNHMYYEGYFHSRPSPGPFHSMHSRLGYDFDKPAGPLRLTAFLEALRRVNEEWTEHLKAALTNLCKGANTPNVVATKILQLLTENRHFADVSSQIHFGDEVPPERANFHNDGPNSALHVALSINGRRSLFWRGSKDPAFRNEADVYSCNPTGYDTHEEKQSPGSVYLSSPFIVSHGVGYTQSSWEERIIAVQCRCLFTRAEINAFQEATEYEWRATMEAVSACVGRRRHDQHPSHSSASHPPAETSVSFRPYLFRLPSMAEVKLVHDELLPLWGQQHGQHEHSSGECEKVAETGTSSATSSNQHGISEY